jgi:hypothetical protein
MDGMESVFDRLDRWRLLPQYQLERRSDIFFSFYLIEALNRLAGLAVREPLVPEFPVLNRRINDKVANSTSFKIDYLAPASDPSGSSVFVELKTDDASLTPVQIEKTCKAMAFGIGRLASDVVDLYRATGAKSRPKYGCLLFWLKEAGMLEIPDGDLTRAIPIRVDAAPGQVVVVRPAGDPIDNVIHGIRVRSIGFAELRKTVLEHGDELSKRFAQSLERWEIAPGKEAENCQ